VPLASLIEAMDRAGVAQGVLVGLDAETATGRPRTPNDHIAKLVAQYPDRLIGFASVDPWKGKLAVQELERAIRELGLRGVKFHPPMQAFFPNDRICYPLYELCQDLGVPILLHTGFSGPGMGKPGGLGVRLKYGEPIPYIDDVATDFPELTLICAHFGWPWTEEMLSVALHKANVCIDLSGWAPRYFPRSVVQYMNTLLQDKCLFGTDYPYVAHDRWLAEFQRLDLKDEVREKVLERNARRILRLE
ncbi:MAG: amidohydrolase, partial [Deltaproteobacteria bacterium]|nr:amidohydrolase [Deltaproteobacteria bacterium]